MIIMIFSSVFIRCFLSNKIKKANTKARNKFVNPIVQSTRLPKKEETNFVIFVVLLVIKLVK